MFSHNVVLLKTLACFSEVVPVFIAEQIQSIVCVRVCVCACVRARVHVCVTYKL